MYVCICKGITEEMIKEVRSKGLPPKEILKKLGVGQDCGTCILNTINSTISELD